MWARGNNADQRPDWMEKAIRDAAVMGLTLEIDDVETGDGLWEEHLPAWSAWCAVSMQWRTEVLSGLAGARLIWLGLDYVAAKAGIELSGVEVTPEIWAEVRVIEEGAVEELNRGR